MGYTNYILITTTMENNQFYSVLVNAVIAKDGKILISQRSLNEKHQPGSWTIPGGKIENYNGEDEIFDIVDKTLAKEIREEVGIEIFNNTRLIANNTFRHTKGHIALALVFLCEYKEGIADALDDTINVAWISPQELNKYDFAPNVCEYISKGFAILPFMHVRKSINKSN